MSNKDIFSIAIRSLISRKTRTFLTILGAIIGTVSVVVMVSLGVAMEDNFNKELKEIENIITSIKLYNYGMSENAKNAEDKFKNNKGELILNDYTVDAINNIEGVEIAFPVVESYVYAISGKYKASFSLIGVNPSYINYLSDTPMYEGRSLDETDINTHNVTLGYDIPTFFIKNNSRSKNNNEWVINPLKDRIEISTDYNFSENLKEFKKNKKNVKVHTLNVVGVHEEDDWNTSWNVFMDIEEAKNIVEEEYLVGKKNSYSYSKPFNEKGYEYIFIKAKNLNVIENIQDEINQLGYELYTSIDYIKTSQNMTNIVKLVLFAIGSIAFIIAAINISNNTLMSIYERTKEIGIMKVIGASIKDIKRLFLLEVMIIGFIGGLIGIIFSLIISFFINLLGIDFLNVAIDDMSKISYIPVWLALVGLTFSVFISVISGYIPVLRATKISALSAMRE